MNDPAPAANNGGQLDSLLHELRVQLPEIHRATDGLKAALGRGEPGVLVRGLPVARRPGPR